MDITHEILNIADTFDRSESAHILKETINTEYAVEVVTEASNEHSQAVENR